jgi:hypothetical protein
MRFRPQISRETQFVSVHIEMPTKVDKIFVGQLLDPRGGNSYPLGPPIPPIPPRPLGPLGYFGSLVMNPCIPPLSPKRLYCWPLNYPGFVKDFDLDAHVKVFKVAIKVNGETKYVDIVNLFSFTFKDIMSN